MFFNNAFPMDWTKSEIAFWLAFTFFAVGMFFSAVCCSLIPILWYLMLSLVFRYKILNNQFRTMGLMATEEDKCDTESKQSLREHQSLYVKDLLLAMKSYDNINGYTHQQQRTLKFNLFYFWKLECLRSLHQPFQICFSYKLQQVLHMWFNLQPSIRKLIFKFFFIIFNFL